MVITEDLPRISPSQMSTWMSCSKEWEFGYIDKIKRPGTRRVFEIGGYFHELCHVYYQLLREGQKPGSQFVIDYMDSRIKRSFDEVNIENVELVALVTRMIRDYVKYQSPNIDRGIKVIEVEDFLEYKVELPSGKFVILNGYADLIYRDRQGRLRVRDHKTGAQPKNWHQGKLKLNPQLLFYSAVYWQISGEMALDVEINYVNSYNYKRNPPPIEERFKLLRHQHTEHSIRSYWDYLIKQADKMLTMPPVENYSEHCTSCQYNPICDLALRGFPTGDLIRSSYEKITRNYSVQLPTTTTTGTEPSTQETNEKDTATDESSKQGDNRVPRFVIPSLRS